MLTHCTARFVDRDMFMRYRGGGIGHKYMRAIEEIYENMSREQAHHKASKQASSPEEPMNMGDVDGGGSDDEHEPDAPTNIQTPDATGDDDNSDLDGSDYEPPETDSGGSGSSGESNTDDVDSEGEVPESYGLGGL